jgi:uncharacterized protein YihD (DUF1040 family)
MRNPNRIPEILEMIKNTWERGNTDLRFCQLLQNIIYDKKDNMFNIEDDELIEMLEKYNKKIFQDSLDRATQTVEA